MFVDLLLALSGKIKVFHFKNGGLNDLIQLFRSWKLFNHQCHKESHQHTFTIFRPKLSLSELHPEEGSMPSVLTEDMWWSLMDQAGRIMDSRYVLRVGGVRYIAPLTWTLWGPGEVSHIDGCPRFRGK